MLKSILHFKKVLDYFLKVLYLGLYHRQYLTNECDNSTAPFIFYSRTLLHLGISFYVIKFIFVLVLSLENSVK